MQRSLGLAGLVIAAIVPALVPANAAAQSGQAASTTTQVPDRRADFLFGRPRASIGLRGTWVFARAGSDLFDFVTDQLTIEKSDFNRPAVSADIAVNLTRRLQLEGGVELARMKHASEYRRFVDNSLRPIEQTTSLDTTHLTAGVRYALAPRGRDISRLVWVPSRVVPFVGAGAGAVFYRFSQYGDFVDFVDNSVFSESFRSQGWAPTAHVFGGVDLRIHRGLYATLQGRYTRASGKLGRDFIDFDPIDLSGFRTSAGINLLF